MYPYKFLCAVCANAGLQNDHKSLMKEIETELYKLHEQLRLQCEQQQPMDIDENQAAANQKPVLVPFARVDRVDAGSPSEKAVSSSLRLYQIINRRHPLKL